MNLQAAITLDETVTEWNKADAPTFDSFLELAAYEVERMAELTERLKIGLEAP